MGTYYRGLATRAIAVGLFLIVRKALSHLFAHSLDANSIQSRISLIRWSRSNSDSA